MISKGTLKLIHSLDKKKYRQKEKLFIVEGEKNISEVLCSTINVKELFATSGFISKHKAIINNAQKITEISGEELRKTSLLKSPKDGLALCEIPALPEVPAKINDNLAIYLDGIQDPGNLGTIIRICDWFGITYLFCSPDTADLYNPKVIQASMGSFCRLKVLYSPFQNIIELANRSHLKITGAFLDGKNLYQKNLTRNILLVIGNEGNGIRKETEPYIAEKIKIPSFAKNGNSAESLNAAIATGIICSEIRRQNSDLSYSK